VPTRSQEEPRRNREPAGARPKPMARKDILPWLVELARTDVKELAAGPPGDIPNLIYRLRTWLDLEPDEPLNADVRALERDLSKVGAVIRTLRQLLETVADRGRFQVRYERGAVILDCAKLGTEGGRALSYRDARLKDAVLRVALDDIYEDAERALRIRRCADSQCRQIFFAERPDQTYCNHACANRTASRRYREKHGRLRAEQAHERYKEKVRRMQSGAVIKRIPRKYR
jgi:hypothetical protein